MQELGGVLARAFHEPKELDKMFKPELKDQVTRATRDPDSWERDEWWKTRSE